MQAFDCGINVIGMGDASNEVFLYNNCVADYNLVGVQVNDATSGSLVLLRNNVVVNNSVSVPEPVAYDSLVLPGAIVVMSDNGAFASPANAQTMLPPNQDINGTAASEVRTDLPPTLGEETASFVTMDWDATPGAANTDFHRTRETGPLHASSATSGVDVGPGTPNPHDTPVGAGEAFCFLQALGPCNPRRPRLRSRVLHSRIAPPRAGSAPSLKNRDRPADGEGDADCLRGRAISYSARSRIP